MCNTFAYLMQIASCEKCQRNNRKLKKSAGALHPIPGPVMCRHDHGCQELLITDQGREFVDEVSGVLYSVTHTEHRITSAYHLQVSVHLQLFNMHNYYLHIIILTVDQMFN